MVWVGLTDPPCLNEPEGIYYVDPFKTYRIVEKLKSDIVCDDSTTIEEIENSGYIYIDSARQVPTNKRQTVPLPVFAFLYFFKSDGSSARFLVFLSNSLDMINNVSNRVVLSSVTHVFHSE